MDFASWLRLREPYDHLARDLDLLRKLTDQLPRGRTLHISDLAAGIGSGFRYLSPRIDAPQRWRLIDLDQGLLNQVSAANAELAGLESTVTGDALAVGDHSLRVELRDLREPLIDLEGPVDLVVTSALLDIVSSHFLDSLAGLVERLQVPLLAALSVDGRLAWTPEDAEDSLIHRWYRSHQLGDRGFGASPGVDAVPQLAVALRRRGFEVRTAEADWAIPPSDRVMLALMVRGIAEAAGEMSPEPERVEAWLARKLSAIEEGELALAVGHLDLLAIPPS